MTVGLDLSVIQTPHRMRGIGATAINFVNNLSPADKKNNSYVFYMFRDGLDEAISILELDNLDYSVRFLENEKRISLKLPSKLRLINSVINNLGFIAYSSRGDTRVRDLSGLDAFLQFNPSQSLPKSKRIKTGLILYDLIPYVMEADYLWSYKTARRNGNKRRSAFKKALQRRKYIINARSVCRSADELFAISNHTKLDYVKYAGVNEKKIKVVHLGIKQLPTKKTTTKLGFKKYVNNNWGYFNEKVELLDKPFLLYIGGADPRRKIVELVAAFNNLRARGQDIRLVMVGDTMLGPYAIPIPEVQTYIAGSSYINDIIFLGFVSDEQREFLYEKAIAVVYPSVYEGFGLPILEAMQQSTPVITYKNTSIEEIAGGAAIYANDFSTIREACEQLISNPALGEKFRQLGKRQAAKFPWQLTSQRILKSLALTAKK